SELYPMIALWLAAGALLACRLSRQRSPLLGRVTLFALCAGAIILGLLRPPMHHAIRPNWFKYRHGIPAALVASQLAIHEAVRPTPPRSWPDTFHCAPLRRNEVSFRSLNPLERPGV